MQTPGDFLFAIDLEDVRDHVQDGHRYAERVPQNTQRYLDFLRKHEIQATFFTVGTVAERYPDLIRKIIDEGHEMACHTHTHIQLDKQTPESLREDLSKNLEALQKCGADEVVGFRAPTFSMIESTQWAYEVLEELGFTYSSSVNPGHNPLYGWPGFGQAPKEMGRILELPLTLHPMVPHYPISGGIYFRVFPWIYLQIGIRQAVATNRVIQSYFHPYDIDLEQERFMHPDIKESRFYNMLMYYNRSQVFSRLEKVMKACRFISYRDYLKETN